MNSLMKTTDRATPERVFILWIAVLAAVVLIAMLCACQAVHGVQQGAKGVEILGETIQIIDLDGSGSLSFMEIVAWFYGFQFSGRALEGGVKVAARKVKSNGRKHGGESGQT